MKKKSSSQASWSLLSEGVSGARVEAHILRSALNQVLSALDDQPQVKEAVYTLCGDSFSNMELHLSKMERDLDRTSYALITMGDAFYRQQLTHEDRELVDQASVFVPKPTPTIVEDAMRRAANMKPSLLRAKEEVTETIYSLERGFDLPFSYKFDLSNSLLKVVFMDSTYGSGYYNEYEILSASKQAEAVYNKITNRRGESLIPSVKIEMDPSTIFISPTAFTEGRKASTRRIAGRVFYASSSVDVLKALSRVEGVEDLQEDDGVITFIMDKFENKDIEEDIKRELSKLRQHTKFEKGSFTGLGMVHFD